MGRKRKVRRQQHGSAWHWKQTNAWYYRQFHRLLKVVTGGKIALYQCGERRRKRGWLEGRFRLNLLPLIAPGPIGSRSLHSDEGPEIIIQFTDPEPPRDEEDQAYAMLQQDMLGVEIADKLKCSKSKVTKLLQLAHERRGESKLDGRTRKSSLAKKQRSTPIYLDRMDEVMRLWQADALNEEIAEATGLGRDTITKIVREWHRSRNLPVPDGRTRRKRLARKSRKRL